MGMNRNTRYQVAQGFKRTSDVAVNQEDKDSITKMAIAHFAVGNCDEFMLGINTLEKLQAQQDLSSKIDKLEQVMTLMASNMTKNDTP